MVKTFTHIHMVIHTKKGGKLSLRNYVSTADYLASFVTSQKTAATRHKHVYTVLC